MDPAVVAQYSLKILAVTLTISSACIATAANLPDLGLARSTIAVLAVVQSGISVALLFLPRLTANPPVPLIGAATLEALPSVPTEVHYHISATTEPAPAPVTEPAGTTTTTTTTSGLATVPAWQGAEDAPCEPLPAPISGPAGSSGS